MMKNSEGIYNACYAFDLFWDWKSHTNLGLLQFAWMIIAPLDFLGAVLAKWLSDSIADTAFLVYIFVLNGILLNCSLVFMLVMILQFFWSILICESNYAKY